jgi:hypothetical protein
VFTPLNLPDEIWERLKTWAKAQACSAVHSSLNECEVHVRRVCREITGNSDALRDDVVAFYAREAHQMIFKYRETVVADGGVA